MAVMPNLYILFGGLVSSTECPTSEHVPVHHLAWIVLFSLHDWHVLRAQVGHQYK